MSELTGQSSSENPPPNDSIAATEAVNQDHSSNGGAPSSAWAIGSSSRGLINAHDLTIDAVLPSSLRTATLDEAPEMIGPYRILEKIGEGGMGIVYQAEQRTPVRRIVALKVIKIGMDTKEVVARFEAERQALAMMSHPNVARVLDAGATDAGRPYFVMEYVPGVPLTDFCDDEKLSVRRRLELFCDVCHAIQHAHQKGIIHRDLKPSNILVSLVDGKAVPKVIDFGIAKATTSGWLTDRTVHTLQGMLIGTPEYASPEQAMTGGQDVDTRTDVFSLGVILYQLLTGTLPLDGRTLRRDGPEGIARILREVEPPKPSTRLNQLRRDATPPIAVGERLSTGLVTAEPTPWAKPGGSPPTSGSYLDLVRTRQADPKTFPRDLRGDLDWITVTAMEKDRSRRYATAQDLAADIGRYLADEPVLARPPSTWYRVSKFIRRNRAAAAAIAVVTVVLIGGALGTTYGMIRAQAEQEKAETAKATAESERGKAQQAQLVAESERAHAQTALADLKKSQAQGVEEARHAAEQAERILKTKPVEAERLAAVAYDRVLAGLGPSDPTTLAIGDIAGRAFLLNNKASEAVKLLTTVARLAREAHLSASAWPKSLPHRARIFSDLADAITADSAGMTESARGQMADQAADLRQEALDLFHADPSDKSQTQLDVGERLATTLQASGKVDQAERAFRQTLDDHRRILGEDDPRTGKIIDRLATLLVQSGRNEKALEIVKYQLTRTSRLTDNEDESRIWRRVDVADILLRLGKSEEASAQFAQALEVSRQRRAGAEGGNQIIWRFLTLRGSFGNPSEWKSKALRGNAWIAMEEALNRMPSKSLSADEVDWSKAQFKLQRWNGTGSGGPASTLVASGSLDDLKACEDPPSGAYLLSLVADRSEGPKVRGATWVLMADWKVALFEPGNEGGYMDRAKIFWQAITGGSPASRFEQKSLLFLYAANMGDRIFGIRIEQGPNGRQNDWAAVGESQIALPAGLYRVAVASDDGARFQIDSQTLVDAWRTHALQTDANVIELDGKKHEFRAEYFQGTGDYTLRLQLEPYAPEADAMMASALGENSSETRRWYVREGQWLERLGRMPEAVERYRRATEAGTRFTNAEQDLYLQSIRGFVRTMTNTGQGAEVAPLLEKFVNDVSKKAAPSGEVAAETMLMAARLRVQAKDESAALADLDIARAAAYDQPGLKDNRGKRLARRIILARLGSTTAPNDGRLPAQLYCALDEAMLEDRSLIGALESATPSKVGWKLVRWEPSANNPTVAEGTFADPSLKEPLSGGLYIVQFRIPISGGDDLVVGQWIFVSHWETTVYTPDGEGNLERFASYLLQNPFRAAAWPDLYGQASMDAFQSELEPDGPSHRYGMESTTRVRLPPGRYRFLATAADAVRIQVDDKRVIHSWPSRQLSRLDYGDADFDQLNHILRVEHFRTNAEDKLFIRIEPQDPAARAFAASLGVRPISLENALADQNDALHDDAFHAAAFSARGMLNLRAGRLDQAIADWTAAAATDNQEPLFLAERLAAAWHTEDAATYRRAATDTLKLRYLSNDRTAAGRTLIGVLLANQKPLNDYKDKYNHLLSVATAPAASGDSPQALFAKALLSYRWDSNKQAAKHLQAAVTVKTWSPGHAVMCDFLKAMIAKRNKDQTAAQSAYDAGVAKLAAWEKGSAELRWDAFDSLDWMYCKALKSEAKPD